MKTDMTNKPATIMVLVLIGLFFSGCAALQPQGGTDTTGPDIIAEPARDASNVTIGSNRPIPLHHDFKDILFPGELSLDQKDSFVYMTGGLAAGYLRLQGRAEGKSLITFFENNMAKDNWRQVSSFRSARSLLLFAKKNRTCVMLISDKSFNTEVEVWVAPAEPGSSDRLMQ